MAIPFTTGHFASYKVGDYEFLAEVKYRPLWVILQKQKLRVTWSNPPTRAQRWSKSVVIHARDEDKMIQALINICFEDRGLINPYEVFPYHRIKK